MPTSASIFKWLVPVVVLGGAVIGWYAMGRAPQPAAGTQPDKAQRGASQGGAAGAGAPETTDAADDDDSSLPPTEDWLQVQVPGRSWPGYTLILYERRTPALLDPNGRVVHSWPGVRASSRARLTPEGDLVYISADNTLRRVSWEGEPLQEYRRQQDALVHHDVQPLPGGGMVGLFRDLLSTTDDVVIIDGEGKPVWVWHSAEPLAEDFRDPPYDPADLTHFNSVQLLPPNRHHDAGDARFTPGNALISSRHLDLVFIVDRESGEVVWRYRKDLDGQHEAILLERDLPGAGNMLIFNNRRLAADPRSEVIELNPASGEVLRTYTDETFFTDAAGVAQKLPNGNLLITSSRGGRIFEVTPDDAVVWQWSPPYMPLRAQRYALDHCPQLAKLPAPEPRARTLAHPWVDRALHAFRPGTVRVKGRLGDDRKRALLAGPRACQELWLPVEPTVRLHYGFLRRRLPSAKGRGAVRMSLRALDGGEEVELFSRAMKRGVDPDHERKLFELDPRWHSKRVEMCFEIEGGELSGPKPRGFAVAEPRIRSGVAPKRAKRGRAKASPQSAEELERTKRQLKALGYVE